ncbi:MAG: Rieske (2Fe-2S) protein [Phycisphaeraceae bacterium]|nr:Rieske (2Fe-2S) protein [Phycisphaeraceae bacterium]
MNENPGNERGSHAPDGRPPEEQPRWRQDFPIDWTRDQYVARREFVKFMILTSLAFVVGQFWLVFRHLKNRRRPAMPTREIVRIDAIPVGGSRVFEYPEPRAFRILVRLDQSTFVAYAQQCTHLACPVIPDPAAGVLHCPCHHGLFDLRTGQPLAGPPRRALQRVTLKIEDGHVFATGVEGG